MSISSRFPTFYLKNQLPSILRFFRKRNEKFVPGTLSNMILFKNSTVSPEITALYLTAIFLCFIASSCLNPIVFFYNKKKTSIAGLLFTTLSALDFSICLIFPSVVLYYAATIDLTKMDCSKKDPAPQPQLCSAEATITQLLICATMLCLNFGAFLTTGVLAIVRSIQIRFPFYHLNKFRVLLTLVLMIAFQIVLSFLFYFVDFSESSEKRFYPSFISVYDQNPYGLVGDAGHIHRLSTLMTYFHVGILQFLAASASAVAAVTLFRQRKAGNSADLTKSRTLGAVKVFLTNLPSLVFGIVFATPFLYLIEIVGHDKELSEKDGWTSLFFPMLFPMLSSVWNPIIFISLTPKSRKYLVCKCRRRGIEPG